MQGDLTSRLSEAHENSMRYKKVEAVLKTMRQNRPFLEEKVQEYKEAFAKESLGVYKLEEGGLSSFFHSAKGGLNEKLRKERSDAMKARLLCRQAEKELDELDRNIGLLEAEKERHNRKPARRAGHAGRRFECRPARTRRGHPGCSVRRQRRGEENRHSTATRFAPEFVPGKREFGTCREKDRG
jgi:hypothetical protein